MHLILQKIWKLRKIKKGIFSYVLYITLGINPIFGFEPYEFKANRFTKPPVIDGYLNDPCWEQATRIDKDFRIYLNFDDPEWGKIAPIKTIALVGYDDKNLYLGFICAEPHMEELRANAKKHGVSKEMLEDDRIEIFINPSKDKNDIYCLWVNPKGIHNTPIFWSYIAPGLLSENELVDIIWYSDGKILDTCWTVEIQIPFQSLKIHSNYIDYWRIDFGRVKAADFFNVYHLSPRVREKLPNTYYARMYINDWIAKPEKIEFLPYGFGGLSTDTVTKELNFRAGFGARYYFNYENILDFALLPDFSQIETDMPQIDVNAISALYYQEKRPFFTERKSFFEAPLEVFYSRMINDPLFAIKYAGSIKDYSFGYIFAIDQHSPFIIPFRERSFSLVSDKYSSCNVLRVKKSLLLDAYLGLITTDREILDGGFNRISGLDGGFGFWGKNTVKYQALFSWTKEPFDTLLFNGYGIEFDSKTARFDAEEFTGNGILFEFNHNRKYLNFKGYLRSLSPGFRADQGYINYNGYTKYGASFNFPYVIKKSFLYAITPELKFEWTHKYWGENTGFMRGGALSLQFKYSVSTQFSYQLADKFYRDNWFNDLWTYSWVLSSYALKSWTYGVFLNYGREINYFSYPLSLGYSLYPYFWTEFHIGDLSTRFEHYRYLFWTERFGEWIYDQKTYGTNLTYTFTRIIGIRVICQYNSGLKNLLISPLFSFTPTPLTIFYFGSNHNFSNEAPLDICEYEHTKSQIFLKVQYLFRQ